MVEKTCEGCGEGFYIPEWRANQGRGRFHSRACANRFLETLKGSLNPRYTGRNTNKAYKGSVWNQARKAAIERAGGRCQKCGVSFAKVKKISVHHLTGSHQFACLDDAHTLDNLQAICQSCHAKEHGLGKIKQKGGDANV